MATPTNDSGKSGAEVIATRENTHGDYREVAFTAQLLKANCRTAGNYECLPPVMKESLDMFCSKMARILHGNADEPDHWRDIAGYAELVRKKLELFD